MRPPFSRLLTLKSCADYNHDALPLSRIYVSSTHYVSLLEQALFKGSRPAPKTAQANSGLTPSQDTPAPTLQRLTDQDAAHIASQPNFPTSFRHLGFESVTQLHAHIKQHSQNPYQPTFALINGIGTGLGDNVVGIGVLQRLIKLLAPIKAQFCLLQELEERIEPLYRDISSVSIKPCLMPLNEFSQFDFYIDFSSIKNMPSFNDVAAAHFNCYAFSVKHLLPNANLQANLTINQAKTQKLKTLIHQTLPAHQPTVLLHPLASSQLRTLSSEKAAAITKELINQGYNVISAFDHANPPKGFLSLADQANSIDDFIHLINAVDAVISVGTVTYHLASALGKPTLLLPTVQADLRSASLLPEVLAWTPKASQALYLNLHKSDQPEDLAVAEKIWRNLEPRPLISAFKKHINGFKSGLNGRYRPITAPPRVAVVLPHLPKSASLTACIDSLCNVEGFDPQALITVETPGLGRTHHQYTTAFNKGIEQALQGECDYVWLLHDNARLSPDYLSRLLTHFKRNMDLGILGGHETGLESLYANAYLKPDYLNPVHTKGPQQHLKQGLKQGLQQPWVNFSSCLIKSNVFNDVPTLNERMQRLFCDIDFCIQAARFGWQTWHDPTAKAEFVSDRELLNTQALDELKNSATVFYHKWGDHFKAKDPEQIEQALLEYIGF